MSETDIYYQVGTISLTQGQTAITGSGTAFDVYVKPGDILIAGGSAAAILSVNSATSLTLGENWAGDTLSGSATYFIVRTSLDWHEGSRIARTLADVQRYLQIRSFIIKIGVPTADEGLNGDAAIDIGSSPWRIFVKRSSRSCRTIATTATRMGWTRGISRWTRPRRWRPILRM